VGKHEVKAKIKRWGPRRENFKIKEVETVLFAFLLGELNFQGRTIYKVGGM